MRGASLASLAALIVATFVASAACSDPRVSEDRDAACANHIDDDGDGLIDCDDPDCAGTRACEKTTETCANKIDDDRNGTVDCRQESCRVLPACRDAELKPSCRLIPEVAAMGCALGKSCYLTSDGSKWCALEGSSLAGVRCGDGDPSDRSQGCAAAHNCDERKRCARICSDDYDCTRNSLCRDKGLVKLCSASCLPGRCDANEECVAFQRDGEMTIAGGGWAHECRARAPAAGRAALGMPCADRVVLVPKFGESATLDSEICEPGLLCIPGPSGAKCRRVCAAATDGSPRSDVCEGGTTCYAVVPFSAQSARFDESYAIGVCLP